MNTATRHIPRLLAVAAAAVFVAGCAATLTKPAGADSARSKLTRLQSNSELASRAPVEIKEAEQAVRAAEVPSADTEQSRHAVLMADRKVDTAAAVAQGRLLEDQRKSLGEQRETARLDSRTLEADKAQNDATLARADADSARKQAEDLQRQIAELNAKATDRGLVMTLGDVLFATGKSELRGGTPGNLGKLAAFLNQHPDRMVTIEGHTDSVGSEESNRGLSERRASAVKSFLVSQGVATGRVTSTGMGEGSPVADNESSAGRQQNRRVEVIIANTPT